MGILDKFKKEKKEEKKEERKDKIEEKPEEKEKTPRIEEKVTAHQVLIGAHVTEKAMSISDQNQYVFKVRKEATKPEIKKAVQDMYGVDVLKVRTINVPRKKRRTGRTEGWRKGFKKAIVKIKEGQKIEVI